MIYKWLSSRCESGRGGGFVPEETCRQGEKEKGDFVWEGRGLYFVLRFARRPARGCYSRSCQAARSRLNDGDGGATITTTQDEHNHHAVATASVDDDAGTIITPSAA